MDALTLLTNPRQIKLSLPETNALLTKNGDLRDSCSSLNELAMPTCVRNISCVELYDVYLTISRSFLTTLH
jgi:hypothetical protein